MLISIIIPSLIETNNLAALLAGLAEQTGNFEIIVVNEYEANDDIPAFAEEHIRLVSASDNSYEAQLDAGATAARGDVLFFLDPATQLPGNALRAIERNLKLLPQTIGGNFHLIFNKDTLLTKLLARALKWWRYRGRYYRNSGIFVRTSIYETLGGFQPGFAFADFDLARRMEKYGPTLYLPEAIIAPTPTFREGLTWLVAPFLMKYRITRLLLQRICSEERNFVEPRGTQASSRGSARGGN